MATQRDSIETVGTILTGSERRDAIHIAVVPCIASTVLNPGERVGFNTAQDAEIKRASPYAQRKAGIVDPFLKDNVQAGQRFWLFLDPQTTTGLRHVWSHPAFPDEEVPA